MEPRDEPRTDRGQAVPLLLAVVVLAAVAIVGIGELSERIIARARAQTAADAAALAATSGGWPAATRLAALNGGALVAYDSAGDEVLVAVDVGGEVATARATDGP